MLDSIKDAVPKYTTVSLACTSVSLPSVLKHISLSSFLDFGAKQSLLSDTFREDKNILKCH